MNKSRHILLSEKSAGTVRFLSGIHVTLDEGKNQSWVTVTRTGKFSDPRYGEFEISRDMLNAMVKNFNERVYGQDIFYDVAHEPANGAAGKVLALKVEGDRLRAQVEWTPYGIDAIKNKGYAYSSIEYHDNYTDNESKEKYGPVMMGAGLVVRPAIKRLDPILLSEASGGDVPTLLHPELQSKLIQEIQAMFKKLIEQLKKKCAELKLDDGVAQQLIDMLQGSMDPDADEKQCKEALDKYITLAESVAKQVGSKPAQLNITAPGKTLSEADITRILDERAAAAAAASKKLAEGKAANVKLLSETINAATGIDDETKKELAESVADLITPEMSADQVKRLAENQIAMGNKLAVAQQLAAVGYGSPSGSPRITVDSSNEVKALQEEMDKRLFSKMPGHKRYALSGGAALEGNKALVESALALYDAQNGHRLHAEYKAHKKLAAGDSVVSDAAVPSIFERTVLRESLSQLVGLGLCDVGTDAFSAVIQLPYSYRDTSGAGVSGVRKYEGQAILRAAVKQALDEARPIPQKLAFEVSDELRYLVGNGQINWDIVAENARNATRIIGEDSESLIFNEHLNAADQYGAVAVTNEATATADGTKTIFCTTSFPVVRPKKVYDLAGSQVGSTLYPVVVKSNNVTITEYDGTGTQTAGLYYSIDYNLGEVTFVSEAGVPTAPTNTHAIVCSYSYTSNVFKWDSDLGSVAVDDKYNDFLYRFGLRKAAIEDRAYMANMGLMSGTLRTQVEQAKQFGANFKRPGTDLMADGNLGTIKDVACFRSYAPGLNMGDVRTVIGERGTVRYRLLKAWQMGQLQDQKDSNGRFTGKKEAYGDQFVVVHTPTQLKGALTSMVVYSATGRVDR